jgi:hypothetical protein
VTPAVDPISPTRRIRRLFQPATVAVVLGDVLSGKPRLNGEVERVRVERCWPGRRGEFVFEWSFTLGRARRHTLFGLIPASPPAVDDEEVRTTAMVRGGLSGVCRYLPDWKLLLHSPDCDPAMPQLAECLDARTMADRLRPLWGPRRNLRATSAAAVECRALGYRSGKRAVIVYRLLGSRRFSERLLGKTFRGGRAERLAEIHRQLSEQLASYSRDRVHVPLPAGCLPDLRMTLFSWAGGKRAAGTMMESGDGAFAAVDVLAALHRASLDDVPAFSVADERGIVDHWHAALRRVAPSSAAATRALRDRLRRIAGTVEPTPQCTIHRDFYERQLIVGRRTTTLLDLDTLAQGSPTVDLGNLLAHAYLAVLDTGRSRRRYDLFARELVTRYEQQMGPVDRRALAFFWATALFRVCGLARSGCSRDHRRDPALTLGAL